MKILLCYVLKDLMPKTTGYARHYKLLKKLDIPVPPLLEQERIVVKLDAAFAEIDEAIVIAKEAIAESSHIYQNELSDIFKNIEDCEPRRTLKDVAKEFGRGKSKHRPRNDEI